MDCSFLSLVHLVAPQGQEIAAVTAVVDTHAGENALLGKTGAARKTGAAFCSLAKAARSVHVLEVRG